LRGGQVGARAASWYEYRRVKVGGKHYRTIWLKPDDERVVQIIDQRALPHQFVTEDMASVDDVVVAIRDMHVRGAGLIGAAAGYGMYLAAVAGEDLNAAAERLTATRPTAINLRYAVERQLIAGGSREIAAQIANEDAEHCRAIGEHGVALIEEISRQKNGAPVNVLTMPVCRFTSGWMRRGRAPGLEAHGMGTRAAWSASHRHHGQRRRPFDAARRS
jgi:hypothetical protein